MSDHSIIAPSAAHEWIYCSGSPLLSAFFPSTTNPAAERGNRMHAAAKSRDLSGLTPDDARQVQRYLDLLPPCAAQELRVSGNVHPAHFGTVDALWYEAPTRTLCVVDLKTGRNKVSAIHNWQLVGYAAEASRNNGLYVPYGIENYRLGIFQPTHRNTIDWWTMTAAEFEEKRNVYVAAAHKVFDKPELTPGAHCKYCKAKTACAKMQAALTPTNTDW
jgi:hypothetical protein